MPAYVMGLGEVDRTKLDLAGGKGASLGELSRIEGVLVPEGFVVTTHAFERRADAPREVDEAIAAALSRLGEEGAYAVRSSATAEDSPEASFAGQHDTFLDVTGRAAILAHVRRCWDSLFSERAVAYRRRQGLDDRRVRMAVVVQRMVAAEAAGVAFTADPITSNRKVTTVEATFGLGEALVSGRVNADVYRVRDGAVVEKTQRGARPVLGDERVVELARLSRRIEAHFGAPQDIEWCLGGGALQFVQSRPITTLYPVPDAGDRGEHVFVSVGHQQMMTDPMKPLGRSLFQLTAGRPMFEAGGRLFVDTAKELASPPVRDAMVAGFSRADPLTGDALRTLVERGFIETAPPAAAKPPPTRPSIEDDPAIVADLIARHESSLAALEREIETRSGTALIDFVREDILELRRQLADPRSMGAIMAGMNAASWLNDQMLAWLGEKNVADTLSLSAPNNVSAEMGLALLDVADVIRPHPEVVEYLRTAGDDGFLDGLAPLEGGPEAREAIAAYLERYGMRGVAEIDVTRPRWSERPTALVPSLLGNVRNLEPGAGRKRQEQGREEAARKERELLAKLAPLPDGKAKAAEAEQTIRRLRMFAGFREYPKYAIVRRYAVYKRALLLEAERLVSAGVIDEVEDIFFFGLEELREVVQAGSADRARIERRKREHERNRKLVPPRVITSDGEIIAGAYRRAELPAGALPGLAVSSGVVEGRARVLHDMAGGELGPDDILVTPFTDPSWTPVFLSIKGLITEVGGLMTHGAVIAREYGLPAVVGVERATERIADGQPIRVNGTEGWVEILPPR